MTKRALISVYNKNGIAELARGLHELGWEIVSTGGTATEIRKADVPVTDVSEVTKFPEIMGGRVKTLHPKIHGGILADRSKPEHLADMEANDIGTIDLVVSNLYAFSSDPSIELIDIGGPSMVRGAAKNYAYVGVVVRPKDYERVLRELKANGVLSEATRLELAAKAFAHTTAYDASIAAWFEERVAAMGGTDTE